MVLCNLITPTLQPSHQSDCLSMVASIPGQAPRPLSTVFGGSRLLFEMIPRANALFALRLAEQAAGQVEPTLAFMDKYVGLSRVIEGWRMSPPLDDSSGIRSASDDQTYLSAWAQSNMAAECTRHALRIYMMAASLGSQPPTPEIDSAIQREVEAFAQTSRTIMDTACASNMMWAVIIVGSCVRSEILRQELLHSLESSRYQMRHLLLVRRALELLWADDGSKAFGPYRLRHILEKNHIGFCIF